jgi:hypothetical protein
MTKRRVTGWGGFSTPIVGPLRGGVRGGAGGPRVFLSLPLRRRRKLLTEPKTRQVGKRGD